MSPYMRTVLNVQFMWSKFGKIYLLRENLIIFYLFYTTYRSETLSPHKGLLFIGNYTWNEKWNIDPRSPKLV